MLCFAAEIAVRVSDVHRFKEHFVSGIKKHFLISRIKKKGMIFLDFLCVKI
jgi:hypothetical protein